MASRPPRTRLEQRVQSEHLSLRDFLGAFHTAGKEIGESEHVSERQAKRWLAGDSDMPRPVSCRILEHWWGEPVATLLGEPSVALTPALPTAANAEELFTASARDAGQHALSVAQALDAAALEQLHADAQSAARSYFTAPPLALFADLVQLRTTVCDQLDRTRKPRQEAELYLLLGQVSGLLSSVSTALGYLKAAEEHARAAFTYGRIIDHASLCAWARALQVAATFWDGRPRQAVEIGASALEAAPAGTARVRLYSVQARALALIGARDEAHDALHAADAQLDRAGGDVLLDEFGGELGFSAARAELCASSAYIALGEAADAERAALSAVTLFEELDGSDRWAAGEIGARIDLGTARTLRGDLAGAQDALSPVFLLEPQRRTEALSRRLVGLGRVLASRPYRGAIEAVTLGGKIEKFTARSLSRTARALGPGASS